MGGLYLTRRVNLSCPKTAEWNRSPSKATTTEVSKQNDTILLNHDTGWVIGRALLLARRGAAIRKEVKLRRRDAKAAKQIVKNGPDLYGRLVEDI